MKESTTDFQSATIILPAMNETFSFEQTVDVIVEECDRADICEFIAVVCDRTTKECLSSIENQRKMPGAGVRVYGSVADTSLRWGAIQDAIDIAKGSHLVMMSTDLETDPHVVANLIAVENNIQRILLPPQDG